MEVRVVGKGLIDLQLKHEEHYLTEHGALKVIEKIQYAVLRMKNLAALMEAAENQGNFRFKGL